MDDGTSGPVTSIADVLGSLQDELSRLKSAVAYIDMNKQAAEGVVEAARRLMDKVERLGETVDSLVSKIDGIDFPGRLDKLDATTSSVVLGVQTLQLRLESTERNIKDDATAGRKAHESSLSRALQKTLETLATHRQEVAAEIQQLRTLVYVTLGLAVLGIAATLLSKVLAGG